MRLHARSVQQQRRTCPGKLFDDVVESEMIESGDIKTWKAEELARHRR